jgi:hypothetical protein
MRRRVTDFADRIRTVIDKLDDPNNNSSCACPARRSRSDSASRSTHWIRPDRSTSNTQPTRPGSTSSEDRCVPSVVTDGQSYRLAQATAGRE